MPCWLRLACFYTHWSHALLPLGKSVLGKASSFNGVGRGFPPSTLFLCHTFAQKDAAHKGEKAEALPEQNDIIIEMQQRAQQD